MEEKKMRNNGRTARDKVRRTNYRKRNGSTKRLHLLVIVVTLVIIVFSIRILKVEFDKIQVMMENTELMQYKNVEMESKEAAAAPIDYVSSIGTVYVEAPVQRTEAETIQRLKELCQLNPTIKKIYKNRSIYPEKMLIALANNPEMADFVAGYTDGGDTVAGRLTSLEKEQDYPLLLQWDPRWGYLSYGADSNMGLAGCGPTCLSMVLYYLTGDETLTPDKITAYAMDNNYYVEGIGTSWALMNDMPALYGITVTEPGKSESTLKAELDKGRILIFAMGKGDFTLAGHFIVIYGYDDKGFRINDPNCVARSRKQWSFNEIEKQIKKIWSYEKF